jgi:hypothetical protein
MQPNSPQNIQPNQTASSAVQPFEVLAQQMLSLNNPENPFTVEIQGNQVIATWNIIDAKWQQLFYRAAMKETYKLVVTLKPEDTTAKYTEKYSSVSWQAGLPILGGSTSGFKGKTYGSASLKEYNIGGGAPSLDLAHSFNFDTKTIKEPVFAVLAQCGWKLKLSFFDKLFG